MSNPTRPSTRNTNAEKHPGLMQNAYSCKTSQQAQAERDQKAAEKNQKLTKRQVGAHTAATLENQAQAKAKTQKEQLGVPKKPQSSTAHAYRQRSIEENTGQEVDNGAKAPAATPSTSHQKSGQEGSEKKNDAQPVPHIPGKKKIIQKIVYKEVDEIVPSNLELDSSESDFVPVGGDEDMLDDIELEDDEADTELGRQGGKKEKKGVTARNRVRGIRDQLAGLQEASEEHEVVNKRKAVAELLAFDKAPKKAKSTTSLPSGVKKNWEKEAILLPHALARNHRSASSTSVVSVYCGQSASSGSNVTTALVPGHVTTISSNDDDLPAFKTGGISSDDDEVERKYIVNETANGFRYHSIAKIEDIEGAPTRISKRSDKKTARPTFKDLPAKTSELFNKSSLLEAYNATGELNAWESLPDKDIAAMWNHVFSDIYPVTIHDGGDGNYSLFVVVKKLVFRGVSSRIYNRLAEAAVTALEDEYDRREISAVEDRANFVIDMLGNDNDTNCPFLWQTTDSVEWEGGSQMKGLFMGRLVLKTLAVYLALVTSIRPDISGYTPSSRPRGALMLSIQAVHRALQYSVSGKFKPPGGKAGSFSQENWGDYEILDEKRGKMKLKQRSTIYQKRVDNMPDAHWAAIMDGATAFIGRRKGVYAEQSAEMDVIEADDDDDEAALYDPMFA
ncbi:hypothetical protein BYT27DRAFT_7241277 [Phlegmacium glaucopus]|nr:hypothetical protein BYT27DRAFT_7241277 [Phlegmacium glaucopus]